MEKFKKSLKRRLNFTVGFNILVVVFIVLTAMYGNKTAGINSDIADMIHGFQVGIFVGIQIVMLVCVRKYKKALLNEDELKKLYIEENDERIKLIKDKIGGVGLNFSLVAIAAAAVISGFFNELIFLTLVGVLVFIIIVKVFLKIYYKNKF